MEAKLTQSSSQVKHHMLRVLMVLIFLVLILSIIQCLLMYSHCTDGNPRYLLYRTEQSLTMKKQENFELNKDSVALPEPTTSKPSLETPTRPLQSVLRGQLKRQERIRDFCRKTQTVIQLRTSIPMSTQLFYSDRQKLIYCSVPKVACTSWKRMLQVFEGRMKNFFDVKDKNRVHMLVYDTFTKLKTAEQNWRKNAYYSFLFVRHPFERLFSAYRNKIMQPSDPQFQFRYGSVILRLFRKNLTVKEYKRGKNVTFTEFLKYIIAINKTVGPKAFDEHWQIMTKLCSPCTMKYNYIGEMKTLHEDADEILKQIGLGNRYSFPYNATDGYQSSASSLMMNYFSKVPIIYLKQIYQIYKDDFDAFGYTPDTFYQRWYSENFT